MCPHSGGMNAPVFGDILRAKLAGSGVGSCETREINEEMMSHLALESTAVLPATMERGALQYNAG